MAYRLKTFRVQFVAEPVEFPNGFAVPFLRGRAARRPCDLRRA